MRVFILKVDASHDFQNFCTTRKHSLRSCDWCNKSFLATSDPSAPLCGKLYVPCYGRLSDHAARLDAPYRSIPPTLPPMPLVCSAVAPSRRRRSRISQHSAAGRITQQCLASKDLRHTFTASGAWECGAQPCGRHACIAADKEDRFRAKQERDQVEERTRALRCSSR